jgi:hypothetical protein
VTVCVSELPDGGSGRRSEGQRRRDRNGDVVAEQVSNPYQGDTSGRVETVDRSIRKLNVLTRIAAASDLFEMEIRLVLRNGVVRGGEIILRGIGCAVGPVRDWGGIVVVIRNELAARREVPTDPGVIPDSGHIVVIRVVDAVFGVSIDDVTV